VPSFISFAASIAELTRGEKSHTQSITHSLSHSPSLFDAPGMKAFTSKNTDRIKTYLSKLLISATTLSVTYMMQNVQQHILDFSSTDNK